MDTLARKPPRWFVRLPVTLYGLALQVKAQARK